MLNIYFEDFVSEKIFFNILYIVYYLTEDFDKSILTHIFKRKKLLTRILTKDIDTAKQENIIQMKIIKNLLKEEDEGMINVSRR